MLSACSIVITFICAISLYRLIDKDERKYMWINFKTTTLPIFLLLSIGVSILSLLISGLCKIFK